MNCGDTKDESEFYEDKNDFNTGKRRYCKDCCKLLGRRDYYQKRRPWEYCRSCKRQITLGDVATGSSPVRCKDCDDFLKMNDIANIIQADKVRRCSIGQHDAPVDAFAKNGDRLRGSCRYCERRKRRVKKDDCWICHEPMGANQVEKNWHVPACKRCTTKIRLDEMVL